MYLWARIRSGLSSEHLPQGKLGSSSHELEHSLDSHGGSGSRDVSALCPHLPCWLRQRHQHQSLRCFWHSFATSFVHWHKPRTIFTQPPPILQSSHCTDEAAQVQRGEVICTGLHSKNSKLLLEPRCAQLQIQGSALASDLASLLLVLQSQRSSALRNLESQLIFLFPV